MHRSGRSVDRASNRDPQIRAQSMDSCAKYGSTDCAARFMDCADPQIAPNINNIVIENTDIIRDKAILPVSST